MGCLKKNVVVSQSNSFSQSPNNKNKWSGNVSCFECVSKWIQIVDPLFYYTLYMQALSYESSNPWKFQKHDVDIVKIVSLLFKELVISILLDFKEIVSRILGT